MSSRTINRADIIGNVGEDPRATNTKSGTPVTTFRVATNRTFTPNESDKPVEETEWHQVVTFGKLAEICEQIITQGTRVYITGRLQNRTFYGDEGDTFERVEVVASEVLALENRKEPKY